MYDEDYISIDSDDELMHYGTPRHSGRYPWGSGKEPFQHSGDFLSRVDELKAKGMTETQIAETMDLSTTNLRAQLSLAKQERRSLLVDRARSLKEDGLSNVEIAEKMGLKGESTVRSLLNSDAEARMNIAGKTAESLKQIVDEKGMLDIGVGTEKQLNISREKLNTALEILKMEGYEVYGGRVPQATNKGKYTTLRVLCPPGTEHKEIFNYDKINYLNEYVSRDNGDTFEPAFRYPESMDSKRLKIRYAEDGGLASDGLIEIRRGTKDLSLGESNYAQVRILVDGTHYLKGMAVYSDDMPDGVDVIFNTNKSKSVPKMEVLKKIKDDPENPFGANIKERGGQSYYDDPNGKYTDPVTGKKQSLSLINKRSDEGDWQQWSHELPSQFLSKQPKKLIDKQLNLAFSDKDDEFNEIMSLTNPTIKRSLLQSFADDCDSAAVHLKAAALPGQTYKVILPLRTIKDNEIYCPTLKDGSEVALVRYPHGGTFEIPVVKVNNRNKEAKNMLGTTPLDAVGISSKVASRLSGADFDGDTVMVIPLSDKVKIKSTEALKGLKGFDPTMSYGPTDIKVVNGKEHYFRNKKEYSIMGDALTQNQMGKISNLITDMTLKGATDDELARAVRHSMVVIDANKHKLDYKQSYIDNDIENLKQKYQEHYDPKTGKKHAGASTLISKAKSPVDIPERKEGAFFTRQGNLKVDLIDTENNLYRNPKTGEIFTKKQVKTMYVDPKTGKKLYHDTNREYAKVEYKDKSGKVRKAPTIVKDGKIFYKNFDDNKWVELSDEKLIIKKATVRSSKMAEVDDARLLSSGTPQEEAYALYANKMKALANKARKESMAVKDIPYSSSAKNVYSKEVESLNYKLRQSQLNAPRERQAQTIAASIIKSKIKSNPKMTEEQKKKISQQELVKARAKVGAKRNSIKITDEEWKAIQAGAISPSKLKEIVKHTDTDILKQYAMPRPTLTLSTSKVSRIKNMASVGYTTSEIAEALGVSPSTVSKYLKGEE